ncbi:hypothetical protein ES705_08132 [subsurface metagenome]
MKTQNKNKKVKFLTLGIFFGLLMVTTCNFIGVTNVAVNDDFSDDSIIIDEDTFSDEDDIVKKPKSSGYRWTEKDGFVIDPTGITSESVPWTDAVGYDWCSGTGTAGSPYIIQDTLFNATGEQLGLGIFNSEDYYFKIENCTFTNSGDGSLAAGLRLISTKNGTITNCTFTLNKFGGIFADNCKVLNITGNFAEDNNVGIAVFNSFDLIISNNTAFENYIGIVLNNATNSNVTNNEANYNDETGIFVQNSEYVNISLNEASYNSYNGITIIEESENIIISENTLFENDLGIFILNSDHNTISKNTVCDHSDDFGIFLSNSHFNNITENDANFNDIGIFLIDCSFNNVSLNNVSFNFAGIGLVTNFLVTNNNNNTVVDNEINNCTMIGLIASYGENLTISRNDICYNDATGMGLSYLNYTDISENNISYNGAGIMAECFNNGTIVGNKINNNSYYGIALSGDSDDPAARCEYNHIIGNNISYNSIGLGLNESDNNTIVENWIIGNDLAIQELDCENNFFKDNVIYYELIVDAGITYITVEPLIEEGTFDVGISINLTDGGSIIFACHDDNPFADEPPAGEGRLFLEISLSQGATLGDGGCNFTIEYDPTEYTNIQIWWYNESSYQWEELQYIVISYGVILVTFDHLSVFSMTADEVAQEWEVTWSGHLNLNIKFDLDYDEEEEPPTPEIPGYDITVLLISLFAFSSIIAIIIKKRQK